MAAAVAPEPLSVTGPVPEHLQKTVDKTLEKIAERAPLARPEQFALEAIIIPDKRPAIEIRDGATSPSSIRSGCTLATARRT